MMLKDLTDEKLIRLNIEDAEWEKAIRKSAQPLIDEHKVKPSYVDDMITGVKENGPYIVLTKHVALPHARPESGALESAIGIATLKTPVVFGNEANDPVKYLFCLSAKDNMEHLNALAELAGMFEDAQFYRLLDHGCVFQHPVHQHRAEQRRGPAAPATAPAGGAYRGGGGRAGLHGACICIHQYEGGSGHQRKRLSDPDRAWKSGFTEWI